MINRENNVLKEGQNQTASYKAVVFQLVDTRSMTEQTVNDAYLKSVRTFNQILNTIKILEKIYNKPILINEKPFKRVNNISKQKNKTEIYLNNPTILNKNIFVFYFYNNNPLRQDIKELFFSAAKRLNNNYAYNILEGNFDNFNIKENITKFWLGQVAEQLSDTKQEKIQYEKEEMIM